MQYTEDDMNDLFRKAAEDYLPKKGDSNWQDISDRIAEHYNKKQFASAKKTGIYKKYIVLIFLFISISGGWMLFKNTSPDKRIFLTEEHKATSTEKNHTTPFLNENNTSTPFSNPNQLKESNKIYSQSKLKNAESINSFTKEFKDNPGIINKYIDAGRQNNIISESVINQREQDPAMATIATTKIQDLFHENIEMIPIDTSAGFIDKTTVADKTLNKTKTGKENKIKSSNHNVLNKQGGAYIGLAAAIDFSHVKSSSVGEAGYALGFLFGYKLNKNMSLETGLIFNRRNYNSEGRYFKIDKIRSSMPAGMQINSLNTQSAVIEIPIKLKYGLVSVGKSNIFISGGMSAYMITSQTNKYQASLNGNDEQFSGRYNKNDILFPAALNMSIGYEQTISKFLNIRAEPFLKIPLKGMGVGNLPVTSAGMQLGITRKLN